MEITFDDIMEQLEHNERQRKETEELLAVLRGSDQTLRHQLTKIQARKEAAAKKANDDLMEKRNDIAPVLQENGEQL